MSAAQKETTSKPKLPYSGKLWALTGRVTS